MLRIGIGQRHGCVHPAAAFSVQVSVLAHRYGQAALDPFQEGQDPGEFLRGGHGGGDWMEIHRLIRALQTGTPPDMDVYDAAAWSLKCRCKLFS